MLHLQYKQLITLRLHHKSMRQTPLPGYTYLHLKLPSTTPKGLSLWNKHSKEAIRNVRTSYLFTFIFMYVHSEWDQTYYASSEH